MENKKQTGLDKIKNIFRAATPSLISILVGMVIAIILLFIAKPTKAPEGIVRLFMGPFFYGTRGIGNMLFYATPIMLTGLSVAFAFKTGLFNIGASGQFMMGAFTAIYIGVKWTFIPSSIQWIVALLGAAVVGALWASVVGFLKAWRNVNEVITSIMMNYIAMYLIVYLMPVMGIYSSLRNETMEPVTHIPTFGLQTIFKGSFIDGGIIIAVVMAFFIYFILNKTTFGYELKAVGLNRDAAKYAGINEKKSIVYSMMIAGALSGLGGGLTFLASTGKAIPLANQLMSEGFDGIAVALLGMNNPIGVIFSAIFVAYMQLSGEAMQPLGFAPELISMMIGIILYVSALSALFTQLLKRRKKTKQPTIKEETHG